MSVRYVLRPTPESTPTSRTLTARHGRRRGRRRARRRARARNGGRQEARVGLRRPERPGECGRRRLGEDLVGGLPGHLCGDSRRRPAARSTATSRIAAIGSASRRPGGGKRGSHRLDPTARRRHTRSAAWMASRAQRTAGSSNVAARRGAARRRDDDQAEGEDRERSAGRTWPQDARRPAARWPRPGKIASSTAGPKRPGPR